jgi:hypothetical protein
MTYRSEHALHKAESLQVQWRRSCVRFWWCQKHQDNSNCAQVSSYDGSLFTNFSPYFFRVSYIRYTCFLRFLVTTFSVEPCHIGQRSSKSVNQYFNWSAILCRRKLLMNDVCARMWSEVEGQMVNDVSIKSSELLGTISKAIVCCSGSLVARTETGFVRRLKSEWDCHINDK